MSRLSPTWIVGLAALTGSLAVASAPAARLAGTVHIRDGAVAALRGSGEDLSIRRGVRSLRVDLGDTLRTSPHVEAIFLGFDESQVPLEPGSEYAVEKDGLWWSQGEHRVRVLQFRGPPGRKPPMEALPALARARGSGAPRVRGPRDTEYRPMEGDEVLHPNSALAVGTGDVVLLALNGGGRGLLRGPAELLVQRKNLVLRKGRLIAQAGGPTQVILTPQGVVAAAPEGLYDVRVAPEDGAVELRVVEGKVVLGPHPDRRGPRRVVPPLSGARYDDRGRPELDESLGIGGDRVSAAAGVRKGFTAPDPQAGFRGAEAALGGTPALAPEETPEEVARTTAEEPGERAAAVLPAKPAPPATPGVEVDRFGGWSSRDERELASRSAPHPSLRVARGDPFSAANPLWSSEGSAHTPAVRSTAAALKRR